MHIVQDTNIHNAQGTMHMHKALKCTMHIAQGPKMYKALTCPMYIVHVALKRTMYKELICTHYMYMALKCTIYTALT